MDEWVEISLGQLVSLQRGHDLPSDKREDGSVPVMGSFGITGWHSMARSSGPGVTVGRSGASIGVVNYIDEDFWPLNTCLFAKDFHGNNPRFVYYFLKTLDLARHNSGSAQPSLNRNFIAPLRIHVPPRSEQDRIACLLGALDDKIELNRRMNETLEAMARAIFRDWFVDFGPTRAKQEARSAGSTTGTANNTARSAGSTTGNANQEARSAASTTGNANNTGREPYLAPEIWSLFPDRLDPDGKPEGWEFAPLLDHARLISGGTPKTDRPEYWNGSIAWASAKDVSQCGETFLIDTERSITEEGLEKSATRMIPALSTVVVARGATTGRHCMFGREIAMNQTCYALNSFAGHPYWLRCAFEALVQELVHSAHGSVFDTITTRTIQNANVVFPGPDPIDAFEKTVQPLFEQVLSNTLNSRTLSVTRDLLLPKLMSGEICIKDAEKIVEAAA